MKAFLKNYRQSPRKVALVAELIKGKRVAEAIIILDNLPKRASLPIKKLLISAISNAKNLGINEESLVLENVTVNKGIVLKRIMPRARGSASRINKRTSHVEITLSENKSDKKAKKLVEKEEKTENKEVKKEVVKKETKSKRISKKKVDNE
ncbi:MAG: 50S ribosomal protein L22 [Clostridia bacterium]|nr:50S ribosomal protein L22 [Clostridia bacterium]